jgi:hypothetical protein
LKETQDLAKAVGRGSEEFKQLRDGLPGQKKQLPVVKSTRSCTGLFEEQGPVSCEGVPGAHCGRR